MEGIIIILKTAIGTGSFPFGWLEDLFGRLFRLLPRRLLLADGLLEALHSLQERSLMHYLWLSVNKAYYWGLLLVNHPHWPLHRGSAPSKS